MTFYRRREGGDEILPSSTPQQKPQEAPNNGPDETPVAKPEETPVPVIVTYTCRICKVTFETREELKSHMEKEHQEALK